MVKLLSISRSYKVLIEIIRFCNVSKTIISIDSEDILNSVFKTWTKIVCLTNENTSLFETQKEVKSTILQPYQIFAFRQKTFIKFEIPQQLVISLMVTVRDWKLHELVKEKSNSYSEACQTSKMKCFSKLVSG